jgi:hypothetical protein
MKKTKKRIRSVSPDDISDQFPEGAIKLMTRIIPAELPGEGAPTVLIEGDALSLEYFGKWVLAQAGSLLDCGGEMSPKGAGSPFFKKRAEAGIYIHRLPCMNPPVRSKKTVRLKQK